MWHNAQCLNAQSLLKHKDQIEGCLICYNSKVILISETRTTSEIESAELNIDNYTFVRCDSTSRFTGGVATYIKNNVYFSNFKKFILEGNYWCNVLKINLSASVWLIGCLYHSPSASDAEFLEDFEEICDSVFSSNYRGILVGDFNLNYLSNDFYVNKMKNILLTYGISQSVLEPTRITNDSQTLIDYVLSNQYNYVVKVHSCPKITDHSIISINMCNVYNNENNLVRKYRNLSENNLDIIKNNLMLRNWSLNSVDVNFIYNEIASSCDEVINIVSPIQVCRYKSNVPWFDNEVYFKIKQRDVSYKAFKKCAEKDKQNKWETFKRQRNEVVNLLKIKKDQYYYEKIDMNKNNPQLMWKTIKK